MWLPLGSRELVAREESKADTSDGGISKSSKIFIVLVGIFGLLVASILLFLWIRKLRTRDAEPRFIPTQYLKRRWQQWKPGGSYEPADGEDDSSLSLSERERRQRGDGGVDRNTSIRSIITLPRYKPEPQESEKVLGRAGERDGVDVIVDLPETVEEEESRREEEMQRLYELRQARREDVAFRDDNRRLRREAADRGDYETVQTLHEALRERRRASSSATVRGTNSPAAASSTSIVAEQAARAERERRISSVSYADVGLARHDGTRVRASFESEHPLLDGAASMDGRSQSPSPSPGRERLNGGRARGASGSSFVSVSSDVSADNSLSQTRRGSSVSDVPTETMNDASVPRPPEYDALTINIEHEEREEAPPYESPQDTSAPQLPRLTTLPSIEVTGSTPSNSATNTPISPRQGSIRRIA